MKPTVRPLLAAFIVLALVPRATPGAVYYVRVSGNDGNDGMSAINAWQTIALATRRVSAGDTVYVGAGTYTDPIVVANISAASTDPLRFVADRNGTKTGDPGDVVLRNTGASICRLTNCDFVELDGFKLVGSTRTIGIRCLSCNGVAVRGCELQTLMYGVFGNRSSINLERTQLNNIRYYGMYFFRGTISLTDVKVTRSGFYAVYAYLPSAFVIRRSVFYDNVYGGVVAFGGRVQLINCLLAKSRFLGVAMLRTEPGSAIWNSTIVDNGYAGVYSYQGEFSVHNSIIAYNPGIGFLNLLNGSLTHTHNLLYQNGTDFQGTVPGKNEIAADPFFVDPVAGSFRLTVASPAIDAGIDARGFVDLDVNELHRPALNGWDIGCHEFGAAPGSGRGIRILSWLELR